ncbi:MAG: FAD-binding protein, partial [Gammaproteobacteria bacterium]
MRDADIESSLRMQVTEAHHARAPLCIVGGASKSFYGRVVDGAPLGIAAHCGVLRYDPAELVLSARAGTRLEEIETLLAANRQMLGFEPPHFSGAATLG